MQRFEKNIGRGLLIAAALINILPGLGAFSVAFARTAYGVEIVGADMEVLFRHRATLFAILGISLLVGVVRPRMLTTAITANAASFGAFIGLAVVNKPVNAELTRIAWIDAVGLLVLALGAVLTRRRTWQPR